MNYVIYGNNTKEAVLEAAEKHMEKLTFNTREEYLNWAKEWKEDYKYLSAHQRIIKLSGFTKAEKIERANKKIAEIEAKYGRAEYEMVSGKLKGRLVTEYGTMWGMCNYTLIRYMLVVRKASKLRSAIKREEAKIAK